MPADPSNPENRSRENTLAVVIETAALNEEGLAEYCPLGGRRGRLIAPQDRYIAISIIDEAVTADGMLHMMFKLGMCAQENWRRLRGFNFLAQVITGVKFRDGVEVKTVDQAAA